MFKPHDEWGIKPRSPISLVNPVVLAFSTRLPIKRIEELSMYVDRIELLF